MKLGTAIVAAAVALCVCPRLPDAEHAPPASGEGAEHARPTSGEGAESTDRARELFVRGTELFRSENYEGALAAFVESYEINAVNSVLYNMAMCQMALFHYVESIGSFRRYLAAGGDRVPAERREEISRHVADMESRLGELRLSGIPEGAEVSLDGELLPRDRWASQRVRTGRHSLRVAAPGFREQIRQVEVTTGDATVLEIDLELEESPVVPPGRRPVYRRWWFWTIIGVAVVGGAATGVAVGMSNQDELGNGDWNVRLP